MNTSGEAADQIVRMTLNGVEVLLKISGSGAKSLACFLYAVLKDQKKTKGRTRLEGMLKSGKPLEVFSIKQDELKLFTQEAKRYGILYCGLKSKLRGDGMCDIMVKSEDSAKINRIVEKLKHGRVNMASVMSNIEKPETEKESIDRNVIQKSEQDKLIDEILSKPQQKEQTQNINPTMATTEKSPPSEPISKTKESTVKGDVERERPSVRKELNDIRASQKAEADKMTTTDKSPRSTIHKPPMNTKKRKSKTREK